MEPLQRSNYIVNMQKRNPSPFFIVGAPRSGTTMLSVLLDRHSRITIPPETNYFSEYIPGLDENHSNLSVEEKIDDLLAFPRVADLKITGDEIMAELSKTDTRDDVAIFYSLLSAWRKKSGKVMVGEKSPRHVFKLNDIWSYFPDAKIICLIRDGRDVVRSLLKTSWAEPENPRRMWLFCNQWNECIRVFEAESTGAQRAKIHLVYFEKLVENPEQELAGICAFLGESFEQKQLVADKNSLAVPEWEKEWKEKAQQQPDPQNIYAWRREIPHEQVRKMNFMMGYYLKKMGYPETSSRGLSIGEMIILSAIRFSFTPAVQPFVLWSLKVARFFKKRARESS